MTFDLDVYAHRHLIALLAVAVGVALWAVGYLLIAGEHAGRRQQRELARLRLERVRGRMELEHHLADLMRAAQAQREDATYVAARAARPLHARDRRRGEWFQPVPHR